MRTEQEEIATTSPLVVSVKTIVITVAAFVLGIVSVFLINNLFAKEQIVWSTGALLSLVSTVALGAASVTLTWVAHRISRDSEEKLMDVFLKTNEALSSIQTSTGVTEKRMEDLISGRASVFAAEVMERSAQTVPLSKESTDKLTEELTNSLRKELAPLLVTPAPQVAQRLARIEALQREKDVVNNHWYRFMNSIVANLTCLPDVEVSSSVSGNLDSDDSTAFWDVLLKIAGKRIALGVQTKTQIDSNSFKMLENVHNRMEYLRNVTWRADQDPLDLIFIMLDKDLWQNPGLVEIAQFFEKFNKGREKPKIFTIFGNAQSLANQVHSISTGARDTSQNYEQAESSP